MIKDPNKKKKTIFEHIKSTNGKIAIVVGLFVGYQELRPIVKGALGVDEDMEEVIEQCKLYTDQQIDSKEERAQMYMDVILEDVYKINRRYERDSIEYANKHKKFAVGFRSDLNGIMSYRDKFGNECSTRINHSTGDLEFFNLKKNDWDRCFYEDK